MGGPSARDKKRFLRRLAPYWDVHRHRIPRPAYETLQSLIAENRLSIGRGQLANVRWDGNQFQIQTSRGSETADWIINCTGPDCNWRAAKNPLLESARALGLLNYDEQGIGTRGRRRRPNRTNRRPMDSRAPLQGNEMGDHCHAGNKGPSFAARGVPDLIALP